MVFAGDIGSHRECHFRANFYMLTGTKVCEIPNDIPKKELNRPKSKITKGGSLVIFDSDGFHKAGLLLKGKRKIIRGHSHSIPLVMYKAKFFDAHCWLQSYFNITKLLIKGGIRNIPAQRLSRVKSRNEKK